MHGYCTNVAKRLCANACNEYVCIGETTALVAMKHWMKAICDYLGDCNLHFQIFRDKFTSTQCAISWICLEVLIAYSG